jgi:D-glycero-alpha-D-manno-heptose 1-phosphate guanylyltransferase
MVTTAIILAGGFGTRLQKVVQDLPKPMALIRGRPFLEYQMDFWISQGVTKFILSVGYLKQTIIDHFGDSYNTASINYSVEDEPLGTGGALLLAAQGLTETFLVLNGDTFFEVNLKNLIAFHKKQQSELTLSLFKSNQLGRYMGVDLEDNGEILSLQSGGNELTLLANGGVYLVNPSALKKLNDKPYTKSSLENDLLPKFISLGGGLYGLESSGKFIDIGVPEDYYRAQKILKG